MKNRNTNYSKSVRQKISRNLVAKPHIHQCDECGEAPAKFIVKSGEVFFFFDLDGNLVGKETSVSYVSPIRHCCESCAKNSDGEYVFTPLWPKKLTEVHG